MHETDWSQIEMGEEELCLEELQQAGCWMTLAEVQVAGLKLPGGRKLRSSVGTLKAMQKLCREHKVEDRWFNGAHQYKAVMEDVR